MGKDPSIRRRKGRRGNRAFASIALASGVLFTTGCGLLGIGGAEPAPPTPTDPVQPAPSDPTPRQGTLLPEGTDAVEVGVGETVQVSLPEGSTGIGDYWGVLETSDPAIAEADVAIGENVFGAEPEDADGTINPVQQFAIEVTGKETGQATVTVMYCTRTRQVSEDCDQSKGTLDPPVEPVELTVTVR